MYPHWYKLYLASFLRNAMWCGVGRGVVRRCGLRGWCHMLVCILLTLREVNCGGLCMDGDIYNTDRALYFEDVSADATGEAYDKVVEHILKVSTAPKIVPMNVCQSIAELETVSKIGEVQFLDDIFENCNCLDHAGET